MILSNVMDLDVGLDVVHHFGFVHEVWDGMPSTEFVTSLFFVVVGVIVSGELRGRFSIAAITSSSVGGLYFLFLPFTLVVSIVHLVLLVMFLLIPAI